MFLSFLFTFFLVYGHTQDTLNILRSLDREFYVSGEERAEWNQDVMLDWWQFRPKQNKGWDTFFFFTFSKKLLGFLVCGRKVINNSSYFGYLSYLNKHFWCYFLLLMSLWFHRHFLSKCYVYKIFIRVIAFMWTF